MMDRKLTVPVLDTRRLRMEPLDWRHSKGMFELWSAPEVCEYSGPAVDLLGNPVRLPAQSHGDSDRILEFFLEHQRRGLAFRWAVILAGSEAFIGTVGFNTTGGCSELAWHLRPQYWKKGFMYEACRMAISWATSAEVGSTSVEAYIEPGNTASIRLATRLGFRRSAESRDGARRYVLPAAVA